jgi:hypothetical protein
MMAAPMAFLRQPQRSEASLLPSVPLLKLVRRLVRRMLQSTAEQRQQRQVRHQLRVRQVLTRLPPTVLLKAPAKFQSVDTVAVHCFYHIFAVQLPVPCSLA